MVEMSFSKIWQNELQFLMYSLELVRYSSFDIGVFGTKSFFEWLFGLSEILYLNLIGFNIGINAVQFFLKNKDIIVLKLQLIYFWKT